ncbi:MAG: hypothetical protein WCP24_01220 [bacterium]
MEKIENKGIIDRVYNWFKNLTVKGLLGAIFIAFVIIIILTSLSFLPRIMSGISSSLSAALYSVFVPAESATITADKIIINSGEDFTINFKKGDTSISGLFAVSYACSSNADLVSVETNGLKKITCDTPYYLLDNDNSIKIRASTADSVSRLVIIGSFENNDTQKSENIGTVRVTIKNPSAGSITPSNSNKPVSNTPDPTVTPVNPVSTPTQTYYGKPDLAIRLLQVGLLNSFNNQIANQTQFSYSDMVGIKFEVRNDGDTNTGLWSFTATLPSASTPVYNSSTQISLKPGESIIFTLGFTNLTNIYSNTITISAHPLKQIAESNEYNNVIISTITNYSYNSNNYNNLNGYYDSYGNFVSYNNNYNNNNGTLGVTCYGSPSNLRTGDRVYWYANAFGGNGSYHYTWTGSEGLNSTSNNPSKTYNSIGQKQAMVTVESNGFYVSHTCSVNVY